MIAGWWPCARVVTRPFAQVSPPKQYADPTTIPAIRLISFDEPITPERFLGALCARYNDGMSEPTAEQLKARIAELEQKLTSRRSKNLEFRVSEKGGVSVYGLGRFPVTLYYEQWTRLLGAVDELRAFIEENKSRLKTKDAE